jgi:[ribosomal protein S5]-alanine N-acetyltransferase
MTTTTTFPLSLQSSRLKLQVYRERDAEALGKLIASNRERLIRDFPEMAKGFNSVSEASAFVQDCMNLSEARKTFHYGIWILQPLVLIGQIKVKNVAWEIPSAELSYFISSEFLRKGYATEAVLAVLCEAFRQFKFNRVYVRIIHSNNESIRLIEKLGMRHEGLHKNDFRCGIGELHDVDYFSVTGDEFPAIMQKFKY